MRHDGDTSCATTFRCRSSKRQVINYKRDKLVAPQGFEPRYAESESAVLPLNERATGNINVAFHTAPAAAGTAAELPSDAGPTH
jgi:hypothetical protein